MDPVAGEWLGEVGGAPEGGHAEEEHRVEDVVEALVERPRALPRLAPPERGRLEHVRRPAAGHRPQVPLARRLVADAARLAVEPDGVAVREREAGIALQLADEAGDR